MMPYYAKCCIIGRYSYLRLSLRLPQILIITREYCKCLFVFIPFLIELFSYLNHYKKCMQAANHQMGSNQDLLKIKRQFATSTKIFYNRTKKFLSNF